MKNMFIMTGLAILLAGCTSTKAIYKNYESVDIKDGVSQKEAKIIAQRIIISTEVQRDYRMTSPDIKTTQEALKYPDFWFVVFGHNWFSPISMDPAAKTYTELRETQFLVVIDKHTGSIQFSGLWYPKRANYFDWVFDPHAYNREDALVLPPYKKINFRQ